ncbi:MAG: XylR family transcriptional regulator [Opitutae bacterium]|nr:XylR family transcriptional regulator [Opitutae bacterium]MDG1301484.1 XylR family transcriptional regulator [Opitutae bacterium]
MKRIAILAETSLASGRQIVTGISHFLDERNDWSVFQHSGPLGAMDPAAISQWQGDGIIARIANPELLALIQAKGLPTVDVLGNVRPQPFPLVKCNDRAIGASVAKHFVENAHTQFAFIGLGDERWSLEREEGFKDELKDYESAVHTFHIQQHHAQGHPERNSLGAVKAWLSERSTPIGLMVASDQLAPIIFEACHQLGLAIPEHVSVVGVDNDRPFCKLCRPRLSSVEPNHEQVGYRAAQTLERLINGETLDEQVIEVNLHTLYKRLSSELIAIDDPALLKALNSIREHACSGVSLDAIAKVAGLSRSVLQRRFRQKLNRTVGEVILNEKLRIAREMLSDTELPISLVAERSGFNCQEYMNHIFKKHLHTTPRKYRLR